MPFTFTELSALLLHMDTYAAQKFWNSIYEVRLTSPPQAPQAIMPNTFSEIGLIDYINFKTFTTGRTGIEKLYRYSHSNGFTIERIVWQPSPDMEVFIDCIKRTLNITTRSFSFAERCRNFMTGRNVKRILVDALVE